MPGRHGDLSKGCTDTQLGAGGLGFFNLPGFSFPPQSFFPLQLQKSRVDDSDVPLELNSRDLGAGKICCFPFLLPVSLPISTGVPSPEAQPASRLLETPVT